MAHFSKKKHTIRKYTQINANVLKAKKCFYSRSFACICGKGFLNFKE